MHNIANQKCMLSLRLCLHVLLNLLNQLRKRDKSEVCQAFYVFFCNNLLIQELEC